MPETPFNPLNAAIEHDLLDTLPDAVLLFDREFHVIYANAEARRVGKLPAGDLPALTHWELYPETVGTELERVYRTAMESRVPARTEFFHAPFDVWIESPRTASDFDFGRFNFVWK